VRVGVLEGVQPVLDRDLPSDVLGSARTADVGADPGRERATSTLPTRPTARQRPGRVALGLLLVADHEDALVPTGLDEVRPRDGRGRTDRPGGVHPVDGLAHCAERVGERELGHHHAFERVRGFADDDRVDVVERELGVGERTQRRLPDQTLERHVDTLRLVLGLTDADHRTRLGHVSRLLRARTRGSAAAPGRSTRGPRRGVPRHR